MKQMFGFNLIFHLIIKFVLHTCTTCGMLIMKINILVLKLIQHREYAQLCESLLWIEDDLVKEVCPSLLYLLLESCRKASISVVLLASYKERSNPFFFSTEIGLLSKYFWERHTSFPLRRSPLFNFFSTLIFL